MNRFALSIIAGAFALPALAQQTAAPAPAATAKPAASAAQQKVVASINGEVITQEKLNQLWYRLGTQARSQYEQTGGKAAFLENYLRKRLLVQEALKSGFDKRPAVQADMEASKESTLFDRYVRDVVAERIVTPADVRKYYDEHPDEFQTGEKVKARHIIVMANNGPGGKTDAQAREQIEKIASELRQQNVVPAGTTPEVATRLMLAHFADAAKKYSEDASAQQGGELGWAGRGTFDPAFEEAAFSLRKGTVSGIIKSSFGYHLIMVEDKQPAGVEAYDAAAPGIREFLLSQHQAEIIQAVTALTNELRSNSKINVYNENIQ